MEKVKDIRLLFSIIKYYKKEIFTMSIQDKIQRLQTAKSDIANAIAAKGGQ